MLWAASWAATQAERRRLLEKATTARMIDSSIRPRSPTASQRGLQIVAMPLVVNQVNSVDTHICVMGERRSPWGGVPRGAGPACGGSAATPETAEFPTTPPRGVTGTSDLETSR